jgi:hypothetical protein
MNEPLKSIKRLVTGLAKEICMKIKKMVVLKPMDEQRPLDN